MVSKVVNGRTDVAGETRAGRPSADGAQGLDRKTVRRYAHAAPPEDVIRPDDHRSHNSTSMNAITRH
ncbi:hypothetical protein [Streptomyces canus]|uniref:hypothetical protein n=1 Tax=Streptomyces canus TaxID=58343 RepID=UPI003723F156